MIAFRAMGRAAQSRLTILHTWIAKWYYKHSRKVSFATLKYARYGGVIFEKTKEKSMDILSVIIPSAYAQDAAAAAPTGAAGFASFIPLVLMLGVFYFLLIRPQQKKMKEHRAMVEALRRGDKVVTASGMFGTINKIDADTGAVHLEIAPDVVVKILKSSVTEVLTKPEPVAKEEGKKK